EPFPRYMEPGTPAISSIIGLGEAARFIHEIGTEQIRSHLTTLTSQLIAGLDDRITLLGPEHPTAGPVSIRIDDVPAADAGYVFDKEGIAVRTGQHCRSTDEIENSIRISPHIYNTKAEIETTLSVIRDLAP
ncbi:MAG: aminotransferase class V-fold PLP-dependent enzyme, partial [Candidatus Nanohaloarchaeota archaeon QJJ-5]|nr:aminotransferase class V-fold PLP-dependent enzyme [Candidatus Nanohaloarchaeota archaeon QJJ-5]